MTLLPLHRHPGLDPGSMRRRWQWTPDQVRGDETGMIAREVTQFCAVLP